MFFYIPGILVLIVAILIAFLVIPRLAPTILAVTALLLLSLGLYHHYTLFATEYRLSTWQEGLKFWAGPIMIGLLVLTIIGYFLIFLKSPSSRNNNLTLPPLPPANTATNPVTAAINNAINASKDVIENVKEATGDLFNRGGEGNNRNRNRNAAAAAAAAAAQPPKPNVNLSRSFFEKV